MTWAGPWAVAVLSDSAAAWTVAGQAPRSTGGSPGKNTEWVAMPASRGRTQVSALQAASLLPEPPGKP